MSLFRTDDPRRIRRSLSARLGATRRYIDDDLLYEDVKKRLNAAVEALLWMQERDLLMLEEREFTSIPSFNGDTSLASSVLSLLCAIGAMTWHPSSMAEHGAIQYHVA